MGLPRCPKMWMPTMTSSTRKSDVHNGAAAMGRVAYLIDDDARNQNALADVLGAAGIKVISFASALEFREHPRTDSVACLILDLKFPDADGLEVQQQISRECGPPIVFVTDYRDIEFTVRAMKAGAIEFLTKPVNGVALLEAVQAAFVEDQHLRERNARLMTLQARFELLTPREREVFPLVISGIRNKQIAWRLGIREVTVQVHRGQIMRKMAAASFAELVRMGDQLSVSSATPAPILEKASIHRRLALA
jgi:FixJ family two-component response regulator